MDSESSQQFCLRWHNHQSSVLGGLPALLDSGRLTDVTLCAGGRSLRAHRIVLSTCSPYFMDIFKELPVSQQPVVIVLGGSWAELCCLVAFMYAGEVTLPRALLPGLLRLARALHITGLTDLNGNIPEVPQQAEFDESFNSKFESNYSTPEETKFNRQNSDSTSCAESVTSPFQKSFESHLAAKKFDLTPASHSGASDIMQDEVYEGLHALKNFSSDKPESRKEKTLRVKEEYYFDSEKPEGIHGYGRKVGKPSEGKRYLNPVLNELESKNRKIDKIVENLKCNQRKSHDSNAPLSRNTTPLLCDIPKPFVNHSPSVSVTERSPCPQKMTSTGVSMSAGAKTADIFASNNIFMETDSENICCDISPENLTTTIKTELQSSPEILPELKYAPLSGIQAMRIQSPTTIPKLFATCYVCHKQLSNQYNLRVHLETHQNARHACVACSHVSRSRDALRKHVSYRHPQLNTSHGVGRPCKANQNIQTSGNPHTSQTPPAVAGNTPPFAFSNTPMNTSDSNNNSANFSGSVSAGNNNSTGNINNPFGSLVDSTNISQNANQNMESNDKPSANHTL